jgi:hypothetical protein
MSSKSPDQSYSRSGEARGRACDKQSVDPDTDPKIDPAGRARRSSREVDVRGLFARQSTNGKDKSPKDDHSSRGLFQDK